MYISLCEKIFVLYETFWGMKLYQRNSDYIGDFQNISAQLELYQRFFKYIDLSTKNDNNSDLYNKKGGSKIRFGTTFSLLHSNV